MGVLELKYQKLQDIIKKKGSVVVAFSGGVDSSVLAAVAFKTLGKRAIAVTLDSQVVPRSELLEARKTARFIGIKHVVLKHSELKNKSFVRNRRSRCYHCKKMLSKVLKKFASEHNFYCVLEGTNASDLKGHRPGFKALKSEGVLNPMAVVGLTKDEVRILAKKLKLPNYGKPSMACLSSRIPYNTKITARDLSRIEKAEDYTRRLGVKQLRVRCFSEIAVIEVLPKEFSRILKNREKIAKRFHRLGFKRITMDLGGYNTGSMN